MKKRIVVGLTGGIGSGKSTALAMLRRLGAATIDLDEIARRQARPGGAAHVPIKRAFGTADRRALAAQVFRDPERRRRLEALTHPLILAEMRRRVSGASGVVVVAVPLLFEARREDDFDLTAALAAPAALRAARVARRDGLSPREVLARMRAQLGEAERARRADLVVPNDGTPALLRRRLSGYYRALDLMSRGGQGPI